MGTNLDVLVCNNFILYENEQNKNLIQDYKNKYELDWLNIQFINYFLNKYQYQNSQILVLVNLFIKNLMKY